MRSGVFKILVPILSFVFALGAAELGLRVFYPVPFSIERNMYYEADPYTGFKLKANSVGYFKMGIVAQANQYGHRDRELLAGEDVYRILVLGDSFTMGANVEQEQVYVQVLERLAQAAAGPRVEFINTGVGGWAPFQYAEYYQHYGRFIEHDAVLIGFFAGNDTYVRIDEVGDTPTAIRGRRIGSKKVATDKWIETKIALYESLHLARLLLNPRAGAFKLRERTACDDFAPIFLKIQNRRLGNHRRASSGSRGQMKNAVYQIERIKRMADEKNLPLLLALLPDETQVNPLLWEKLLTSRNPKNFDRDMPQKLLRQMLNEAGVAFVDLLEGFRRDGSCVYMNDTHWDPRGHELAARIIFDDIMTNRRFPGLSSLLDRRQ